MRNGLLGSSAPSDVVIIQRGTVTLRPDLEYWVTGAATLRLPASIPAGKLIHVVNATTNAIVISRGGGATISGIRESNGAAITAATVVRILPGKRAVFVANGGNWNAQGIELPVLSFTYNGTPLSNNTSNPLNASDLFHYLGIVQGGGTWTNPANTAQLVSAASGMSMGVVANFTDRVASEQDVYTTDIANSWIGWQFPKQFRCLGFVFQTRGGSYGSQHLPRAFSLLQNTGTTLTSATSVASWTVAGSWFNQTQITTANTHYGPFVPSVPFFGNQLAILVSANSFGSNLLAMQEVFLFGEYFD